MLILPGYDSLLIFFVILCLIPIAAFSVSGLLAPSSQSAEKRTTYESGIEPMGEAWVQFNIRYYMFALVFVVFDVETIFLYPWAVAFNQLGVWAFVEICVFLFVLVIGLVYAWRKGALEWF
uniref:NAD(P)H-quinone oxidoreductase subunit 3, chloroplastic n=1 Tax=Streptosarcina moshanensis TaxID=3096259 RepID=A0AAU7VBU7_9VIRI|nr:subunit 3 of NADH-plastoquinone oxidoreductase [Streptosarcina costaricana]WKT08968.1 subunit 3 of NADH-plastoquinone oxidoreductase [Streptosarcina costaricana]